MADSTALSIVVPVYNGAETIGHLVNQLERLDLPGGLDIILVNDGSSDNSREVCEKLTGNTRVPVTLVDHTRNYGEHNALLSGLRFARGEYIITMDDDLQHPPSEVLRLYKFACEQGADIVYTHFETMHYPAWRKLGSWFANKTADLVLDKPKGIYLSSFRCMKRFVAQELIRYTGPFPYIDGRVFHITKYVACLKVQHLPRAANKSNYTIRRLVHLWLSILTNFSVMPLRLGTFLGIAMTGVGFLGIVEVLIEYFLYGIAVAGWGSLMLVVLLFSGVQLIILGLVGEYLGRVYLTVNKQPQSIIRDVIRPRGATGHLDAESPEQV
jgi:undecaprenyl-phosphate 4-deoxy-4-formamido-L-arabinose transferase